MSLLSGRPHAALPWLTPRPVFPTRRQAGFENAGVPWPRGRVRGLRGEGEGLLGGGSPTAGLPGRHLGEREGAVTVEGTRRGRQRQHPRDPPAGVGPRAPESRALGRDLGAPHPACCVLRLCTGHTATRLSAAAPSSPSRTQPAGCPVCGGPQVRWAGQVPTGGGCGRGDQQVREAAPGMKVVSEIILEGPRGTGTWARPQGWGEGAPPRAGGRGGAGVGHLLPAPQPTPGGVADSEGSSLCDRRLSRFCPPVFPASPRFRVCLCVAVPACDILGARTRGRLGPLPSKGLSAPAETGAPARAGPPPDPATQRPVPRRRARPWEGLPSPARAAGVPVLPAGPEPLPAGPPVAAGPRNGAGPRRLGGAAWDSRARGLWAWGGRLHSSFLHPTAAQICGASVSRRATDTEDRPEEPSVRGGNQTVCFSFRFTKRT